jgi:hypothetical protein
VHFAPGPAFGWSHHNYGDIELDQGDGSTTGRQTPRVANVRAAITGKWAGWPSSVSSNPQIFLTEGGARLDRINKLYFGNAGLYPDLLSAQSFLLQRNVNRMSNNTDGQRIAMLTWYLWTSQPGFDSGLREPTIRGGGTRPAYTAWTAVPAYA